MELSQLLTVIDSPGMGDSEGRDEEQLETMFKYFSTLYYGPNLFVLTKEIDNPRLSIHEKKSDEYFICHVWQRFTKTFSCCINKM